MSFRRLGPTKYVSQKASCWDPKFGSIVVTILQTKDDSIKERCQASRPKKWKRNGGHTHELEPEWRRNIINQAALLGAPPNIADTLFQMIYACIHMFISMYIIHFIPSMFLVRTTIYHGYAANMLGILLACVLPQPLFDKLPMTRCAFDATVGTLQ